MSRRLCLYWEREREILCRYDIKSYANHMIFMLFSYERDLQKYFYCLTVDTGLEAPVASVKSAFGSSLYVVFI